MAAPAAVTFEAVREVTALEVRSLGPLMAVRALPVLVRHPLSAAGRLRGRLGKGRLRPLIEEFLDFGFIALREVPESELVFGAVGRFWRLADNDPVPLAGPEEFVGFDEPDHVRAALNFTVVAAAAGGTMLATETRVVATSDDARRSFSRYWRLILPGSALIRRSWLAAIRRRAERGL